MTVTVFVRAPGLRSLALALAEKMPSAGIGCRHAATAIEANQLKG